MQLFLFGLSVYTSLQATLEQISKPRQVEDCLRPFQKKIELKNVRFSYTDEEKSGLYDISLTIQSGQMIAIMGASGTRKSTLLDLLLGLLEPQTGEIRIDGQVLNKKRQKLGVSKSAIFPSQPFCFMVRFGKILSTFILV